MKRPKRETTFSPIVPEGSEHVAYGDQHDDLLRPSTRSPWGLDKRTDISLTSGKPPRVPSATRTPTERHSSGTPHTHEGRTADYQGNVHTNSSRADRTIYVSQKGGRVTSTPRLSNREESNQIQYQHQHQQSYQQRQLSQRRASPTEVIQQHLHKYQQSYFQQQHSAQQQSEQMQLLHHIQQQANNQQVQSNRQMEENEKDESQSQLHLDRRGHFSPELSDSGLAYSTLNNMEAPNIAKDEIENEGYRHEILKKVGEFDAAAALMSMNTKPLPSKPS